MSPNRTLSRLAWRYLGAVVAGVFAAPLVAVVLVDVAVVDAALLNEARGAEPITLRLDRDIENRPATRKLPDDPLIRFGVSDIQRRIDASRGQLQELRQDTARLNEVLALRKREIDRLRGLDEIQEGVLAASRQTMDAVKRRVAIAPTAPGSAPAPAAVVTVPAAAPAGYGGASIAGVPLPQWTLHALAGAVLLLLLGVVVLLARNRALARAARGEVQAAKAPGARRAGVATRPPVRPGPGAATARRAPVATSPGTPPPAAPGIEVATLGDSEDTAPDPKPAPEVKPKREPAAVPPGAAAPDPDPGWNIDFEPDDPVTAPGAGPAETGNRWSRSVVARKAADPQALKEVDVLIAFEQFDNARDLLDELLSKDPNNPEYLLRHYHVRTVSGGESHDNDEALLRAMMDGPLSDTMLRVRTIGRGLMPGNPLFGDASEREAAKAILKGEAKAPPAAGAEDRPDDEPFERTVVTRIPDKR